MKNKDLLKGLFAIGVLIALAVACKKKDDFHPDNTVYFESSEIGMPDSVNEVNVRVRVLFATTSDIALTIEAAPSEGVMYPTDFTTTPALASNRFNLVIPAGQKEVLFKVSKTLDTLFDGDETIQFRLAEVNGAPVAISGGHRLLTIKFGTELVTESSLTGDGGGAAYSNKVFFDLSTSFVSSTGRDKWDLGFYNSDYKVILNSSAEMMARKLDTSDLTKVSAVDTIGFGAQMVFNLPAALPYIDRPDTLAKHAVIDTVFAEDIRNKVYIIKPGPIAGIDPSERKWKKIRVLRRPAGYLLQYADIGATTFTSLEITRETAYNFNFVSFKNGIVKTEPPLAKWDIAWTYFTNVANTGGGDAPVAMQDVILQNSGVSVARVLTSSKAYSDFVLADTAGRAFTSRQTGIGTDWRTTGTPVPTVLQDRYYIIKDSKNTIYKLRFKTMTEPGKPAIEFKRISN